MNTIIRTGIALMILTFSPAAFADDGYCMLRFDDDLASNDDSRSHVSDHCEKGDALYTIIEGESKSFIRHLLGLEVAQLCDLEMPVTLLSPGAAICTYRGMGRRTKR